MTKSLYVLSGALSAYQRLPVRICPWEQNLTHLPPATRLGFRAEIRALSIASVQARVYQLYQAVPAPASSSFNPSGPVRNLDRDTPDTVSLVDLSTSPDLNQGYILWTEMGAVGQISSPDFVVSTDQTNAIEFVVEIENLEQALVPFTLELYFDY